MGFVFPPAPGPGLPVIGTQDRFPVRRIWCVGRNYAAHAREMGMDPTREPPFFFAKPADALVPLGGDVPYPPGTHDLHHEIELVVALHKGGRDLDDAAARNAVFGCAVGLDMTRRDLQASARKSGQPWEMAKAFDHSAPCSALRTVADGGFPDDGELTLRVNGAVRQHGRIADMIWNVSEILQHLSRLIELAPGDLIFTGTPEGVGAVVSGDLLQADLTGIGELNVLIV
jgi:fumarylpyruvate hydrolase